MMETKIRVFKCPFAEDCWNERQAGMETLYTGDTMYFYIPPLNCRTPFLENKNGEPICSLEIDRDKLNAKNYRSGIEHVRIHREETSLLEDIKEVFERRRKSRRS